MKEFPKLPWWVRPLVFVMCLPSILLGCANTDYTNARASVYLINTASGGNGSGVMIEPNLMLTAAHVAGDGTGLTVGPEKLPAKLLYVDKDNDIALLYVSLECPCVSLADPPKPDVPVVIIGFPINEHFHVQTVTEGLVQGRWENRLAMTAPASGGNSGGGVFVYQDGEWKLAGILVEVAGWCVGMACYPMAHLSRAVATETMVLFLRRAL